MGLGLESAVGPGVAQDLGLVADVRDEQRRIDPRPIPPIYLPHICPISPLYLRISRHVSQVLDEQRVHPRFASPRRGRLLNLSLSLSLSLSFSLSLSLTLTLHSHQDGCWSRVDRRACSVLLLALLFVMTYAIGLKAPATRPHPWP